MGKGKSNARVTVEEVDALFQRPLGLLRRPSAGDAAAPAVATGPSGPEPNRGETASRPGATSDRRASDRSFALPFTRRWAGVAFGGDSAVSATGLATGSAAAVDQSIVELANRLGDNLIEASCLAAELRRRYRETQLEYQRILGELRDIVAVLADQIGADIAPSSVATVRDPHTSATPRDASTAT